MIRIGAERTLRQSLEFRFLGGTRQTRPQSDRVPRLRRSHKVLPRRIGSAPGTKNHALQPRPIPQQPPRLNALTYKSPTSDKAVSRGQPEIRPQRALPPGAQRAPRLTASARTL